MPFVTLIHKEHQKEIATLVNRLIKQSAATALVLEEKCTKRQSHAGTGKPQGIKTIGSFSGITAADGYANWPGWPSSNGIVIGSLTQTALQIDKDLFFLNDCNPSRADGDYDRFCELVLSTCDWALFSYFTTYDSGYLTFITRNTSLHEFVSAQIKTAVHISEWYDYGLSETTCADLRHASFYDDSGQWMVPVLLAHKRGKPAPLLLCRISANNESYDVWLNEQYEYLEGQPWYQPYIDKLQQVGEFEYGDSRYLVFSVTDLEAYHGIWAKVSTDVHIAAALFAADLDLGRLKKSIEQHGDFGRIPDRECRALASWFYTNCYGGGPDEHIGKFYAHDAGLTQLFWTCLDPADAYQHMFDGLHSAILDDEQDYTLPLLLAQENKEQRPWLLCRIEKERDYPRWSSEAFDFVENTTWYQEDMARLPLVAEFSDEHAVYKVLALTDVDAYSRLWREAMSFPVAKALLAPDCDMDLLQQTVLQPGYYFMPESLQHVAGWVYMRFYGGRMSYFYAKDLKCAQRFYRLHHELSYDKRDIRISRY